MNEEEVWIILHSNPREIDTDLLLDPSMAGRYRMEQITRWRQEPGYFMYRDITAMKDSVGRRRREAMKKIIKEFKEGTANVRRDCEEEDQA